MLLVRLTCFLAQENSRKGGERHRTRVKVESRGGLGILTVLCLDCRRTVERARPATRVP